MVSTVQVNSLPFHQDGHRLEGIQGCIKSRISILSKEKNKTLPKSRLHTIFIKSANSE